MANRDKRILMTNKLRNRQRQSRPLAPTIFSKDILVDVDEEYALIFNVKFIDF